MQDVVFIVNPVAGGARQRVPLEARAQLIERLTRARRLSARLEVTSRAGEARRLAAEAVAKGTTLVIAWGGDGTVNEVGSALLHTPSALGVVPSGSGNGFARTFDIPSEPEPALCAALDGVSRRIDAGEIDGHVFFNVGGIGVDAEVAEAFNRARSAAGTRGLLGYVRTAIPVIARYQPRAYSVDWDQPAFTGRAFTIVFANGRQYGNGFMIAPDADPSDGLLDVAIVTATSWPKDCWRAARFGLRRALHDDHILTGRCGLAQIVCDRPMRFHVDGDAVDGGTSLSVRAHHGVLALRVPA